MPKFAIWAKRAPSLGCGCQVGDNERLSTGKMWLLISVSKSLKFGRLEGKTSAIFQSLSSKFDFYIKLGKTRRQNECFTNGEFVPLCAKLGYIAYIRKSKNSEILVAINRWCDDEFIDLTNNILSIHKDYSTTY